MSTILAVYRTDTKSGWWLILDCGHWYKWSGSKPPEIADDFECPSCKPPIQVVINR